MSEPLSISLTGRQMIRAEAALSNMIALAETQDEWRPLGYKWEQEAIRLLRSKMLTALVDEYGEGII